MAKLKLAAAGPGMRGHDWPVWVGVVVLIFGLLYLLRDLGMGDYTYSLQWYTVLFVAFGLKMTWKALAK